MTPENEPTRQAARPTAVGIGRVGGGRLDVGNRPWIGSEAGIGCDDGVGYGGHAAVSSSCDPSSIKRPIC